MSHTVKVVLIDDSLVIRAALKRLLDHDPDIEVVSTPSNGRFGIIEAEKHKPDVIVLDIEMPVMDGLTALPEILKVSPQTKVIMFSTLTEKGADVTLKAMELGAVECLVKPSSQDPVDIGSDFERHLTNLVKTLGQGGKPIFSASHSQALSKENGAPASSQQPVITLNDNPLAYKGVPALIAIGSSTGGPNALFEVCSHFKDLPVPIVITQHMPATFTRMLATHIEEKTGIPTHEGEEGMALEAGHIYVAPGGLHMQFEKDEATSKTIIRLRDTEPVNFCKPAVDPMIESAVDIYGQRVMGVILTGMGNDGIGGGELIAKHNGQLIAQNEETCTVWGMPRAVAEAGYCNQILPLKEIGPWVRRTIIA